MPHVNQLGNATDVTGELHPTNQSDADDQPQVPQVGLDGDEKQDETPEDEEQPKRGRSSAKRK